MSKMIDLPETEIRDAYLSGCTMASLAKQHSVSISTIRKRLCQHGVEIKPAPGASRRHDAIVMAFAQEYLEGRTPQSIAEEAGVHFGSVYNVFRRNGIPIKSLSHAHKRHTLREDAFDDLTDPETAYWLGFLYADGCIRKRKGTHTLVLSLAKKDKKHLERFRDFLGSDLSLYEYNGNPIFAVSNSTLTQRLISLGVVPRKTYCLGFPDSIPRETLPSFLLGFFDGDGSIHISHKRNNRGCFSIVCFVSKFVEDYYAALKSLLPNLSPIKIRTLNNQRLYELRIHRRDEITAIRDLFYKNNPVFLERKKCKLDLVADTVPLLVRPLK